MEICLISLPFGHVFSVGSLGKKGTCQTVEHVHVSNCNFKGADNGMRIKTWPGGCGYARNIKFEHIVLTNTKNPIIIDQDYENVQNEDKKQTSEVQISGVTYRYVNGTCNSETAIILNCGAGAGCTDIFMDLVNITSTSSGSNVLASCNNAHGVAASTSPPVSCLSL
ncbi:probable polygalacturonase At3g15720 [Glycine soja]|uniref:probable polygalacturonase At3g15720 n=1 Tax=Glycine soja TaxID=3848 RepID=UPI00103C8375|nr:probable polygalacturonase At3g15720 [Glycine soja]